MTIDKYNHEEFCHVITCDRIQTLIAREFFVHDLLQMIEREDPFTKETVRLILLIITGLRIYY